MVHTTTTGNQCSLISAKSEIHRILEVTGCTLSASAPVPLLGTIARILRAGHLQTSEYGSGAYGTSKDGKVLKKEGRDRLSHT